MVAADVSATPDIDLETIRKQFPALAEKDSGVARVYFDNPAGTQVPKTVADAVANCLLWWLLPHFAVRSRSCRWRASRDG